MSRTGPAARTPSWPTIGPPTSAPSRPCGWSGPPQDVVWAYGSTSHGTQVWTGAEYLEDLLGAASYPFEQAWRDVPCPTAPERLRLAYDSGWSWDAAAFYDTAVALLADAPEANAFMWSWCGELSWDTTAVDAYLQAMAQLEADYPGITFVYMTGHTDGPADQVLEDNNQAIRDYVAAHGKVLYDFADIESWDPAGTNYPDTDDSCPWCADWCTAAPRRLRRPGRPAPRLRPFPPLQLRPEGPGALVAVGPPRRVGRGVAGARPQARVGQFRVDLVAGDGVGHLGRGPPSPRRPGRRAPPPPRARRRPRRSGAAPPACRCARSRRCPAGRKSREPSGPPGRGPSSCSR